MQLRDKTFERVFRSAFVYNILFEDTEVDEAILGVDHDSTILAISGAGCGVANHASRHARRVDAVDINPHHLALAALKASGAMRLRSWDEFYALFAHGHHPDAERVVKALAAPLPAWIQVYWRARWRVFQRSLVTAGVTAQMFRLFRHLTGVSAEWLRARIGESVEQRQAAIERTFSLLYAHRWVPKLMQSPLQLIALGINYEQRDRLLQTENTDILAFLELHMKRVAATDLERNWYAWYATAGHFNHDVPDAVPPYLRRDHHEQSSRARTQLKFHNRNIFAVLGAAEAETWSHYTLCDAVDWMPAAIQQQLFREIFRTARPGAKLLYRSVEDDSLIRRHGLEHRFRLAEELSNWATVNDRSRQYRRVNVYEVLR